MGFRGRPHIILRSGGEGWSAICYMRYIREGAVFADVI